MEKNKLQHVTTDKLVSDIRSIIEQGRQQAYAAANQITVTYLLAHWAANSGRRTAWRSSCAVWYSVD